MDDPYSIAQQAVADLKSAIHTVLRLGPPAGMTNADIGRTLGIYAGHVGHENHIPRTMLAIMENEGVVEQNEATKKWRVKRHGEDEGQE